MAFDFLKLIIPYYSGGILIKSMIIYLNERIVKTSGYFSRKDLMKALNWDGGFSAHTIDHYRNLLMHKGYIKRIREGHFKMIAPVPWDTTTKWVIDKIINR